MVNGVERWLSFKSTQDLVNRAIEIYLNEQQKDSMLFGTYLEQWFERYKRPMWKRTRRTITAA